MSKGMDGVVRKLVFPNDKVVLTRKEKTVYAQIFKAMKGQYNYQEKLLTAKKLEDNPEKAEDFCAKMIKMIIATIEKEYRTNVAAKAEQEKPLIKL